MKIPSLLILSFLTVASAQAQKPKAIIIEKLPWTQAQKLLTDTTIVLIPLGAESKEHGPHLLLRNDFLIAEYLKDRVAKDQSVVIYPTVNYHFYPAFLEYAGSTSLRLETAYSLIVDLCRVISAHGPRRFYILNTGVSTLVPLRIAREILAQQGILMTFTDILNVAGEAEKKIKQQKAGTHADEIETSMMLYIAPETVDMKKAAKDIPANDTPGGPLSLDPSSPRYSATGIYGDATLATRDKGKIVVEAMVTGINSEINALRKLPLPNVPPPGDFQAMTGVYRLSKDETISITIEGNRLMIEGKVPRKFPLSLLSANSFRIGERGRVVFFKNESGAFDTAYLNWEGVDYLGRRQ